MNDPLYVHYEHQGRRVAARVDTVDGSVYLAFGKDTAKGWATVGAEISASDARHLAAALLRAADAA